MSTSIAQLQQEQFAQPEMGKNMEIVDNVISNLDNNEQDNELAQQQMMLAQQQQHQQMMLAQQQQQQEMMAAAAHQQQLLKSNVSNNDNTSFSQKLMNELKDVLLVVLVFVLLNLEPVVKTLDKVLNRFSTNSHLVLLAKALVAGGLFFGVKKLVLNK